MNLVAVSTVVSPPEQRKKRALAKKRREITYTTSGIARPETAEEFASLDFSSRCAIAGLQLGRTKVFLRREAFDRIEALRAQKFGKSATVIQKLVRGVQARAYYQFYRDEMIMAAITIQRAYRTYVDRLFYMEMNKILIPAAVTIQAIARGANTRTWYFCTLYSIMRLQALVRGHQARGHVARLVEEIHQPVASPVHSSRSSLNRINSFDESHDDKKKQMIPVEKCQAIVEVSSEWVQLRNLVASENWAAVESTLDQYPEMSEKVDPSNGEMLLHMICRHPKVWTLLVDMVLVLYPKALLHRDHIGALPLHHAAAHDNVAALEIIHSAYKEGVNNVDTSGRQPIHVAAEFDAPEAVKFLLAKSPEGAYTMVHRPSKENGGGLPLHVACRHHSNMSIITSLLAENFSSAKRTDENGDLPIHLLLRNGEAVEQVTVKTILTCFPSAISRTDKNGDLPLTIAIKSSCNPSVVNYLMIQHPDACKQKDGSGHSNLHLAFEHGADDRSMLGLLNHAPELATLVDKETGLLPIQVATEHEHSHFIVHYLLKQDLPIDIKEKVKASVQTHKYSWNHIVSNTEDAYYPVVSKILQQCTQPQVLALAHVEGPDGRIALSTATPVCKHEMRVMLRLFNTLEVVNQRPAFSNPESDTQIFYALRYDPPKQNNGQWSLIHEDNKKDGDYLEEWDDASHVSGLSRISARSNQSLSSRTSQVSIQDKMKLIKKEKGQQVIAKLTSRSDVVERELKIRKDHQLSRHYVPAVISVHHTVQHAAYSEAMAEPGYCITMEGADTTAENLLLDMRKYGKSFSTKILKRIGISLLHMHEHGLVHGDFGTHNAGKFGNRWKLLGVGGSKAIGSPTDPKRGFYHPPEAVVVDTKRVPLGKKETVAKVISIQARPTHDIWAFGVVMYEAICGQPLSPYACRGKRAMNAVEMSKIGKWDQASLERALRHVDPKDQNALQILRRLLHHNPNERYTTLRTALEHPFFSGDADDRVLVKREVSQGNNPISALESRPVRNMPNNKVAKNYRSLDLENSNNGLSRSRESMSSSVSKRFSQMMPGLKKK
jgi:serine/threonine protein kinase